MALTLAKALRVLACVLALVAAGNLLAAGQGRSRTSGRSSGTRPAPFKRVKFKPACANPSYPTPAPSTRPAIDSQCGLAGAGTGPEAAQNSAKNNFCATGTPQEITIVDLTNLQAQVEKNPAINFGNENKGTRKKGPTVNRAPLRQLGEGKLVTLKAYVLIARQEGPRERQLWKERRCRSGLS